MGWAATQPKIGNNDDLVGPCGGEKEGVAFFLHPTNAQERAENHANSFDYLTKKDGISVKDKKLKSILHYSGVVAMSRNDTESTE